MPLSFLPNVIFPHILSTPPHYYSLISLYPFPFHLSQFLAPLLLALNLISPSPQDMQESGELTWIDQASESLVFECRTRSQLEVKRWIKIDDGGLMGPDIAVGSSCPNCGDHGVCTKC